MKVKIVGVVCSSTRYLTTGKLYDVESSDEDGALVVITDDEGDTVTLLTERSGNNCAHLGPNAKAVFVD